LFAFNVACGDYLHNKVLAAMIMMPHSEMNDKTHNFYITSHHRWLAAPTRNVTMNKFSDNICPNYHKFFFKCTDLVHSCVHSGPKKVNHYQESLLNCINTISEARFFINLGIKW